MRRFYMISAGIVCVAAGLSTLWMPVGFMHGILAGGALAIINVRQMHKGLRVLLSLERPSAARLWFSGVFRLGLLCAVIILIAYLRLVNLLGLLLGFALVPALLLIEGLMFARSLSPQGEEAPSCRPRSRD